MTYYEYTCYFAGYLIRSSKKWEHTRSVIYAIYCANTSDKKKLPIDKFMPLITDPKRSAEQVEIHTPEEKAELAKNAIEILNRLQNVGK